MLENELFAPCAEFFSKQGYVVRGEVCGCDLTAEKDGELIICELKRSFSLKLVYQARERKKLTENVYCVIPRPARSTGRAYRDMLGLLEELKIGLITIGMDTDLKIAQIVLYPDESGRRKNYRKLKRLKNEHSERQNTSQQGGVFHSKIMTAYREQCMELLCMAEKSGRLEFKAAFPNLSEKQKRILQSAPYGWFRRVERGIYEITDLGYAALLDEDAKETVEFYRRKCREENK
ncbi:MAG: hypothetical protein IJC39_03525 [Firmicutes bacterium]|nr:hypothetical protein [Bacillota bacterium]